jgi:hypothetical protein
VLYGSLATGGRLRVGGSGKNVANITVKMSSHPIYLIQKFYKLNAFYEICKDIL